MKKIIVEEKRSFSWKRGIGYMFAFLFGVIFFVYALSWAVSFRVYPAEWGVSFSKEHTESLGLDWKETYQSMLDDLSPTHVRISALWNAIEQEKNSYRFDDLDWMMFQAAKRGKQVTLVVGQKAPRWPECHIPVWAKEDISASKNEYLSFVSTVIHRYKLHPALETWQVENEPFITFDFGECAGYDPSIIYDELALMHTIDREHLVMITDSGELNIWWKATRIGDVFGTTVYRMVRTPTGQRFTYAWLPPGLYKMRANLLGRPYNKFYVSELQAEPWFHKGNPTNTPILEQEETMNPDILKKNIHYAERVGASRIYLWGVEWWYYMKTVHGDTRYVDIVREQFKK